MTMNVADLRLQRHRMPSPYRARAAKNIGEYA